MQVKLLCLALLMLLRGTNVAWAQGIVYPTSANVLNVKDYGAIGDGKADDTLALQRALDAGGNGHRIIYLPTGTYLISDTLRWPAPAKHLVMQGQSREGSIICLRDEAPGFGDRNTPRAMDAGKPTVCLPGGRVYRINGTVHIRGKVRRIIGTDAVITGRGTFVFEEGTEPVVVIEGLAIYGRGHNIIHQSARTLVIRNGYVCQVIGRGTGDLFLDDISNHWQHPSKVVESFLVLENPQQKVWCRQINPETNLAPKIINQGATLWILGLKTEGFNVVLKTSAGGKSEVLGAHVYALGQPKTTFCLVVEDALASFVGFRQWTFKPGYLYQDYVSETQQGISKTTSLPESHDGTLVLYRSADSSAQSGAMAP